MTDLSHSRAAVDFTGITIRPSNVGYDEAREVFNGMVDHRPELIMRCERSSDVVAALAVARSERLPVSVYGGGHSVTGSAVVDGGLCIDLRGLDQVHVDPTTRTARVGGGATWGVVDAATQEHGLAVTGGRVSTTGVGGLSLGSGSGWLERSYGFACDNLLSAEVVTADGRVVTASNEMNPDLFWGLRGGGGNLGIVTEFTFSLHPVGPILLGGMLMYPATMAGELLRFWRDFMLDAPDEVGSGVALITAPPLDFVPEPVRGQPVVGVVLCYSGDPDAGREVLAPMLEFGPPAINMVQPMPYVAIQQLLDGANPKGLRNHWSADFLESLPDAAIDTLVSQETSPGSPLTQKLLAAGVVAIARVPDGDTAFGQRDAPWNVHYLSMWVDPADDEANVEFTREISTVMKPWATGRVYLNYIGDEGPGRVEAAFGPEKFARLQKLKRTWDPQNVFRHNQNIEPAFIEQRGP